MYNIKILYILKGDVRRLSRKWGEDSRGMIAWEDGGDIGRGVDGGV